MFACLLKQSEDLMAKQTPLFTVHQNLNAKMMQFRGWDMPLHYGSQIEEHFQVRGDVGLFDVSHLIKLDVIGKQSQAFLHYLLTNDISRLIPGNGHYSCMLNETGGILDDLMVFQRGDNDYRLVMNAGFREKKLSWMSDQANSFDVTLEERTDLAMLSVQGPNALHCVEQVLGAETPLEELAPFSTLQTQHFFISRTGYAGEDGFEISVSNERAALLWDELLEAGAHPCGLGARDTLRLEAGLVLYGSDIDETTSPLVSQLEKTIAWEPLERQFIGRAALEQQRAMGIRQTLVGLILEGQGGVLRASQRVVTPNGATGLVTSGTYSPTLNHAIGLARVPVDIGDHCEVRVRYKYCPARVVQLPFIRHGHCFHEMPSF
jgi:aminomethyltransferase